MANQSCPLYVRCAETIMPIQSICTDHCLQGMVDLIKKDADKGVDDLF